MGWSQTDYDSHLFGEKVGELRRQGYAVTNVPWGLCYVLGGSERMAVYQDGQKVMVVEEYIRRTEYADDECTDWFAVVVYEKGKRPNLVKTQLSICRCGFVSVRGEEVTEDGDRCRCR